MNTTRQQVRANVQRTWVLMSSFLIVVIAIGFALSYYFDNPLILYIAVGFSVIGNIFSYYNSDKIALSTSGAKPIDLSDPQHRELHRIVENLAISQGMPTPGIYVMNDSALNAFATGRDPEHAAMAFTTGMLNTLERNELEGVAAHELSHIKNRDILVGTIAVTLVGMIAIIADLFMRGAFAAGGSKDNRASAAILIIGIIFSLLSPLIARLIHLAISRRREYLADATGAEITRYPEGLASALEKIGAQNKPLDKASTATAHLFFASPFGSSTRPAIDFLEKMFSTHPPIEERISILKGMNK